MTVEEWEEIIQFNEEGLTELRNLSWMSSKDSNVRYRATMFRIATDDEDDDGGDDANAQIPTMLDWWKSQHMMEFQEVYSVLWSSSW